MAKKAKKQAKSTSKDPIKALQATMEAKDARISELETEATATEASLDVVQGKLLAAKTTIDEALALFA